MISNVEEAKLHTPTLVKSDEVHRSLHGDHFVGAINAWVAVKVTNLLSSMWFFWACVVLDLGALVLGNPASWTPLVWIMFASQTVIQLLALPAIAAGQKLLSAASDARAESDHLTLTALASLNKTQLEILEELRKK